MKKKILLTIVLAVPFIAFSQDVEKKKLTDPAMSPVRVSETQTVADNDASFERATYKNDVTPDRINRRWLPMSFIKVGNTKYDLQTNASIGRRVQVHSDGTVSIVFTTAPDNQFDQRGTGYNYTDGTSWNPVSGQTTRIENDRTGWPSIGILPNGSEITMGHSAANGGWVVAKNSAKGQSDWTSSSLQLTQVGARPIWGRMAVSGNYVYMISNYADSSQAGEPRAPVVNGVNGPMTYSRSTDGGDNWDIEHITLPGFDSTRFTNGNPDGYAIDARDSFVAIIFGDLTDDVTVWKSSDYGSSFTKIIADTFKYAPYSVDSLMLDTPVVSDGTYDVLIDANGKVHAWWGLTRVFDDDISNETYSFYPAYRNLVYWNETQPSSIIASGTQLDRDGDGQLAIQEGTYSALQSGNIPVGLISVARLGNSAVLHMPSAGIADDGTIYCTFSLPMEDDIDPNNINLRDICITYSTDGGNTWAAPQNVTQRYGMEDEFACIGKTVNDFVHMVFQSDALPGTNLQSNSTSANNHPVAENGNDIYYAAIPVSVLKANEIGTVSTIEVKKEAEVFVVSQNKPNPFNDVTTIVTYLDNSSDVTLTVTNALGQVVKVQEYTALNKGNHELSISADNLESGIYFYTLTAGKNSITKRMMVE